MTTTKILRIEHTSERNFNYESQTTLPVTNKGFFTHFWNVAPDFMDDFPEEEYFQRKDEMLAPPVIHADVMAPRVYDVCGFKDWDQLNRWFHADLLNWVLNNYEVEVVEYEVEESEVLHGTWQVLVDCRSLMNRRVIL